MAHISHYGNRKKKHKNASTNIIIACLMIKTGDFFMIFRGKNYGNYNEKRLIRRF